MVMMIGIALGLVTTAMSLGLGRGVVAIHAGPWTAWPHNGGPDIDPYARAILARSGEAPLGREEGLTFLAETDSNGDRLDGRCEYRIANPVPASRYWTIGLATPDGYVIDNPTGRYAFASSDVLRRDAGDFEIDVSQEARPGNWISPGEARKFIVVMRLYDTPFDIESRLDADSFPKITKLGCA
jgi:hypothetical protein